MRDASRRRGRFADAHPLMSLMHKPEPDLP